MTLPTRTVEPTAFVAGERVEWTRSFEDYPASAWSLVYKIRGPGTGIDVTATADGDDFVVTIPPATSDDITVAGRYRLQGIVTKTGDATEKFVAFDGWVKITIALATSSAAIDARSTAQKIVEAIDAAMLTSAGDVIEYEISTPAGNRRVKRSREDAIKTRKEYAAIWARERAAEQIVRTGKFGQAVNIRIYDEG